MYVVSSAARYAKLTISGSETVKFPRQFNVFGVKGDNITVSLTPNTTGDGVYNTADGDGSILIAHYSNINTMYLTGSGDVIVWAGNNPDDCPFKRGGKGGVNFLGTTTTALSEGSTANPITIDGKSVTAKQNDVATYDGSEFMFNGTAWSVFGGMSGLGDLAFKDSASATYTPQGTVTVTPHTTTVNSITAVGTLPTLVYDAQTEELTFNAGTLPTKGANTTVVDSISSSSFSGTEATITVS